MSSIGQDIQVGDLAMIVRPMPCCGANHLSGHPFRVVAIETMMMDCLTCRFRSTRPILIAEDGGLIDLAVAKRIPPLDELESERHDEEITA